MVHNTDYVYGVRDDGQHAHKNNVFQIKKDFFDILTHFCDYETLSNCIIFDGLTIPQRKVVMRVIGVSLT